MAATSLDALEALLQFREAVPSKARASPIPSHHIMPVPNPLDPAQPHIIEGDAPSPSGGPQTPFGSGAKSAFSPNKSPAVAAVVASVPNPLATPAAGQCPVPHPGSPPMSAGKALVPSSMQIKVITHGFGMKHAAAPTPSPRDVASKKALEVDVRSDKILNALNSKPQRGKKRRDLSDMERQELTRTRNREHARSTRVKKKARLQELMDMEQRYLQLKEKESLDLRRREQLIEFVENIEHQAKACTNSSRLHQLASREMQKPEFAIGGAVALTTEDSGMVKVSVRGMDLKSREPKSLSGVISVEFNPRTADICAASLFWPSPESTNASVGLFPSVSVLSFES